MEAGKDLEIVGNSLKTPVFDENLKAIIEKLELIETARKKMNAIDLALQDCYTILAGYNKLIAEAHMPKENNNEPVQQGGSGVHPAESSSNKI
jgi:hypothetical protein